jgi:hypothetical protein
MYLSIDVNENGVLRVVAMEMIVMKRRFCALLLLHRVKKLLSFGGAE